MTKFNISTKSLSRPSPNIQESRSDLCLFTLTRTFSGLYCLLLVAVYMAVTVNKLVSSPMHAPEMEVTRQRPESDDILPPGVRPHALPLLGLLCLHALPPPLPDHQVSVTCSVTCHVSRVQTHHLRPRSVPRQRVPAAGRGGVRAGLLQLPPPRVRGLLHPGPAPPLPGRGAHRQQLPLHHLHPAPDHHHHPLPQAENIY